MGDEAEAAKIQFRDLTKVDGLAGPFDIGMESWREYYHIPSLQVYRIYNPVALYYRVGGATHRVVDQSGIVHCVPFNHENILRWQNRHGLNPVGF